MKSRPITGVEFDRMIEKTPELRPDDAAKWTRYLEGLWLSGLRLGLLHGRLPSVEKEATMDRFREGDLQVLVATTVIEVGVDVPNATVMVVLDADRFGIAQLHQLRGRVGRGSAPGLCLFVTHAEPVSLARERVDAVAATLDGFELAQADLELRREGDVLGESQSGGRSSLKLLRVSRDGKLIEDARAVAEGILAGDPALRLHDALREAIERRLDETERAHLFDLARAADGIPTSGRPRRRTPSKAASRLSLRWALEAITEGVAFVRDPHQNLLATNALGRAFYSPVLGDGGRTPNLARFQFLDPASRDFYPDWELFAEMCVGIMRSEAGRDPHDRGLQDLVGELSTRSETFRRLWAAHDVRTHGTGTKRFHHPVVGELTLAYEELAITAEPGLALLVYTAEPGSPSAERLRLLASWAVPADTPLNASGNE